jgi:hypothetical protein
MEASPMNLDLMSSFAYWWVLGIPITWALMIASMIIDHAVLDNKDDISLGQVILFAALGAIPIVQYICVFLILIWLLFDVAPKIKVYKVKR